MRCGRRMPSKRMYAFLLDFSFEVLLMTMAFDVALQRHHEREDPERVGQT